VGASQARVDLSVPPIERVHEGVSTQKHSSEILAELKMKKFDETPPGDSPTVFSCGENQRDLLARISLPMQHSLLFLGLLAFFLAGVEITSRDGLSS